MPNSARIYTFSARIGRDFSIGEIARSDGESVTIPSAEIGDLLLDLAVDDNGQEGKIAHHHEVLGAWFEVKMATRRVGVPA